MAARDPSPRLGLESVVVAAGRRDEPLANVWRELLRSARHLDDAAAIVDAFRAHHPEDPGATLPSDRPTVRLDYFLLGPDLAAEALRCDLGGADPALLARAPDHLPLVLELEPGTLQDDVRTPG